ncbi:uncharacterized protein LOC111621767 [Centruroides sculpturatus]|uniref:uncharacterized protein LOC111621767 n=1 Tax=Centruroides sculpturatus TaxID=218467 RepID=UPI000C6E5A27|nr:uncharacterized protein LOC111621767 [Centruroides sculpturatus]
MPCGKTLTELEIREIYQLKGLGRSLRQISAAINQSTCAMRNVLTQGENYGRNKQCGRPKLLTHRNERKVFQLLTVNKLSVREAASTLPIVVSPATVWRCMHNYKNAKFTKMTAKLKLTQLHKTARLKWAKDKMTWKEEWKQIDEKSGIWMDLTVIVTTGMI